MNCVFLSRILLTVLLLTTQTFAAAETTLVAVATNFTQPMVKIAELFHQATGYTAKLSFGSSGKIASQLQNGAPFEVFLSADEDKPLKLEQTGVAVAGSRFTYAFGTLVLWSAQPGFVDDQGQILGSGAFKHLAVADPKLAPYGSAALAVLEEKGLQEKLQPLLVLGENIAQTHQFVSTGNAELGFVSLSQVIDNGKISQGSGWIVPSNLHAPIRQDAVLLENGTDNPAAIELMAFLKSPQARSIIEQYGYGLPK